MIIAFGWGFSGAGVFVGGSRWIMELVPKWDWSCFGKRWCEGFAGVYWDSVAWRFQFGNCGLHDWAIVLTANAGQTHIGHTLSENVPVWHLD